MNKIILILSFLFNFLIIGIAEAQHIKTGSPEKIYEVTEQLPKFHGTERNLTAFFEYALLKYRSPKEGSVMLSLVIDKTGQPKDVKIISGLDSQTDSLVLKAARKMPYWQPGKQDGQPVSVRLNFPVKIPGPAQPETPTLEGEKIYTFVEQQAEFPGGQQAMFEFLKKNTEYPDHELKNKVEGKVMVSFVVGQTGQLKEAVIIQGVSPAIDGEALRVISSMPAWTPGKQNGKAVNVRFVIPLAFIADKAKKRK